MGKLERHVRDKLVEWTEAGLISPEQSAGNPCPRGGGKTGNAVGILIFAGFGAVVLGLGVILLFAYNWDKMPKFAKLGIIFGAMAAAHGAGHVPEAAGVAAWLRGTGAVAGHDALWRGHLAGRADLPYFGPLSERVLGLGGGGFAVGLGIALGWPWVAGGACCLPSGAAPRPFPSVTIWLWHPCWLPQASAGWPGGCVRPCCWRPP